MECKRYPLHSHDSIRTTAQQAADRAHAWHALIRLCNLNGEQPIAPRKVLTAETLTAETLTTQIGSRQIDSIRVIPLAEVLSS